MSLGMSFSFFPFPIYWGRLFLCERQGEGDSSLRDFVLFFLSMF